MSLHVRPLADGFGAEALDVDLVQIDASLAYAVMDAMAQHALLLSRRQTLDDDDIFRVCSASGPVEEPAAVDCHSPAYKEIDYISNLRDGDGAPALD